MLQKRHLSAGIELRIVVVVGRPLDRRRLGTREGHQGHLENFLSVVIRGARNRGWRFGLSGRGAGRRGGSRSGSRRSGSRRGGSRGLRCLALLLLLDADLLLERTP